MHTSPCACQSVASTSQPARVGLQYLENELQHISDPLSPETAVSYLRTGRPSISTSNISRDAFQVVASTSHLASNDRRHIEDGLLSFDSMSRGAVVSYTSP